MSIDYHVFTGKANFLLPLFMLIGKKQLVSTSHTPTASDQKAYKKVGQVNITVVINQLKKRDQFSNFLNHNALHTKTFTVWLFFESLIKIRQFHE